MSARVSPMTIKVCSACGWTWESHLPSARDRLRRLEPGRYNGTDLPTLDSINVELAVTTDDCQAAQK